jgi:quercetin dioxygenase-like cupin family protein
MYQKEDLNPIFPLGNRAPADYFTGNAWVNILVPKDETGTYAIGNIVFEPGCRNNWHTHPAGQILLITDGIGLYQEKGKEARLLQKGDFVIIPANIEHWHGATKDNSFTHIAVTNFGTEGTVNWLAPVTEEEYLSCHT